MLLLHRAATDPAGRSGHEVGAGAACPHRSRAAHASRPCDCSSGPTALDLLGGLVALQAYRASVRNASSALIHSLYKDFLRLRFDFVRKPTDIHETSDDEESPLAQIAGMKLYVLEEMFSWTKREEKTLSHLKPFIPFVGRNE